MSDQPPEPDPQPAPADADAFPRAPQLRLEPGGHTARIVRTAVDAAGRWLVSGSDDKTVRVWRLAAGPAGEAPGTLERTIRVPLGPGNLGKVYAVAMTPDGETVAVGGWLGSANGLSTEIYLFDRATGTLRQRLKGLPNVVNHLAFDRTGRRLAAVLGGGGLRLYGLATDGGRTGAAAAWAEVGRDPDYGDKAHWADFAADGRLVTSCYYDRVRLYDAPTEFAGPIPVPRRSIWGRIWSSLGGHPSIKPSHRTRPPGGKRPFAVAFSPDGTRIAVGYEDSTAVDLLDGRTLAHLGSADTAGIGNGSLSTVAWSADGGTLFAGGFYDEGGARPVLRWSKAGLGHKGRPLRAASNTVMTLNPLADGGLVVGAQDGIVVLGPVGPGAEGVPRWSRPVTSADFRAQNHAKGLRLSSAGDRIAFGYEYGGKRPALFDLGTRALTLDPAAAALADLALPDEGPADRDPAHPDVPRCVVTDWVNDTEPKLDGRPLKLEPYEIGRSLALALAGSPVGFCLGTEWSLRAYTRDGRERWQQPVPDIVWALNVTRDGRYAVAGYGDGTLRWHRLTDGVEVLAFYPCPDPGTQPRWVLWSPLGHYAASAGGEDLIGWHVNRGPDQAPDFFGASRLRDQFNRPDVIALVLQTADPAEALRLADAARGLASGTRAVADLLPPVLRLLSQTLERMADGTRVDLLYKAESGTAPVLRVEARLDGRPLPVLRDERHSQTDGGRQVVGQLRVLAPPQSGMLSLVAFSDRGAGEAVLLPIAWTGDEDWRKPRLYGLTVGVGAYPPGVATPLHFAAADAQAVAAELRAQAGGLYREVEVRPLIDGAAGRTAILDALHWLEREVGQRDVAVVFLAGHGLKDTYGAYYYLSVDGDPSAPHHSAIKGGDIAEYLRRIQGKVVLMLDTCYSGALLGDTRAAIDSLPDLDRFANELADADTGVVVFSSSSGAQLSREDPAWGHGAFTCALLEAIRDGRADFSRLGFVTLAELECYLAERVKALTEGRQHPTVTKPKAVTDYRMFRVRAKADG
ncbi:caspase family protein [uncultured Thiodictyon sp.]|uniref:caspase family protein n=1 Tax=uncultured Thiodictyon sp. TaxID=1846217 RepID=UPI0025FD2F02|nr:caspase family protein [uncultured Thiodictyon sp.]